MSTATALVTLWYRPTRRHSWRAVGRGGHVPSLLKVMERYRGGDWYVGRDGREPDGLPKQAAGGGRVWEELLQAVEADAEAKPVALVGV